MQRNCIHAVWRRPAKNKFDAAFRLYAIDLGSLIRRMPNFNERPIFPQEVVVTVRRGGYFAAIFAQSRRMASP